MKNRFFLCLLIIATATSLAQKKMIPVTQSALTGIILPAGSMQDKRMLSVSAANAVMDMESKKSGRAVSTTEVLVIPSVASSGFDEGKLANELSNQGWNISINADDKEYSWLQKGNQSILMYFSVKAKESSLYFALDANSPQDQHVNSTSATTGISQNQQSADSSAQNKPVEFYDQKETFDIITYSPPKDWKKEVTENIVSYSIVNNLDKTWCQIGIVKSTNSKGSIEQDFESEWSQLAATPYNITDPPHTSDVSTADGWKIQSGSGQFMFNNTKAAAILTTFSGYGRCVSIIATTGNQRHLNDIENFIGHIELKNLSEQSPQTSGNTNSDILGTWGISASDQSSYRVNNAVMNYITRQYTFNPDGTYSFVSKAFDPFMDKILLGKENGTYQISGNNLSINPIKSVLEAWSKKDGKDEWGIRLSMQNNQLEKVTYQYTKHYFSGTKEWSVVLQADKQTQRDGAYSGGSAFNNAWIYSPPCSQCLIEMPGGQEITSEDAKTIPAQQTSANDFAFTSTNFDDGWVATVKDDWVQVTKGATIVLIHYPNKQTDAYTSVLMDGLKNAWNVLVAPKYSSGSNFEFKPLTNWEPIEFAEADMVEKSSGRQVHVVLFKKDYNSGGGKYVEFITADKKSFELEFGTYHEGSSGWEKMENMALYNKFAVAASDLLGKWTNDFSGAIQYVNAYTGADAGMNTHASNENFHFGPGNTYQWDLGVASGPVGNIKFQSVKSSGNFSMVTNWQVKLSDIEGKPRTYNTYFSCIKGLRILWLDNRAFAKVE
jgi:hypothetical protein